MIEKHGHKPKKDWKPKGNTTERGYGWQWQKKRELILARDKYLCQACLRQGRAERASDVDHIKPKAEGGGDEDSNLESLCKPCHKLKSDREKWVSTAQLPKIRKPLIPVTLVCGPPGSGKRAYVRAHARPSDLILSLPEIEAELSGFPIYQCGPEWRTKALGERNRRLDSLAHPSHHAKAWLIAEAPRRSERRHWQESLDANVILLDVSPDECMRRIAQEPEREGQDWLSRVAGWWAEYVHG